MDRKISVERVEQAIEDIKRSIERLSEFRNLPLEEFVANEDYKDIARSRLLIAIEASINICYHIVAKHFNTVPQSYGQCFEIMGDKGIIPDELAKRLSMMCRFRNRLVHLYWDINYKVVYEIIKDNLRDIEEFVGRIRGFIS